MGGGGVTVHSFLNRHNMKITEMNAQETYEHIVQKTHERIIDLYNEANPRLKEDLRLHYGGHFITGNLDPSTCKTLILSLNPGYDSDLWPKREESTEYQGNREYQPRILKYIEEYPLPLAKGLVDLIFDGSWVSLRDNCAETYVYSPFASPGVDEINETLEAIKAIEGIGQDLWNEHDRIRKQMVIDAVEHLKPTNILIVGKNTWGSFTNRDWGVDKALGMEGDIKWIMDGVVGKAKIANGPDIFVCKHLSVYYSRYREMEHIREQAESVRCPTKAQ